MGKKGKFRDPMIQSKRQEEISARKRTEEWKTQIL